MDLRIASCKHSICWSKHIVKQAASQACLQECLVKVKPDLMLCLNLGETQRKIIEQGPVSSNNPKTILESLNKEK